MNISSSDDRICQDLQRGELSRLQLPVVPLTLLQTISKRDLRMDSAAAVSRPMAG